MMIVMYVLVNLDYLEAGQGLRLVSLMLCRPSCHAALSRLPDSEPELIARSSCLPMRELHRAREECVCFTAHLPSCLACLLWNLDPPLRPGRASRIVVLTPNIILLVISLHLIWMGYRSFHRHLGRFC